MAVSPLREKTDRQNTLFRSIHIQSHYQFVPMLRMRQRNRLVPKTIGALSILEFRIPVADASFGGGVEDGPDRHQVGCAARVLTGI